MDFLNDEEELLITFEKDTVEDAHIAASEGIPLISEGTPLIGASEGIPLINISVTQNFKELMAFIDKEYDEYVVRRNNNSLLSKDNLLLANVLLFMALLITLKLILVA